MQPRRIDIKVTSRAALDERLNAAIGRLQHVAMKERVGGILVTRHLPGHYVAELSSSVPFGLTQERTVWNPVGPQHIDPAYPRKDGTVRESSG